MGRYSLEKPQSQGRYSLTAPEEDNSSSFDNLSPNEKQETLSLTKKQLSSQYPNLPDWLRDSLLTITPKNKSPLLHEARKGITNVTDYIPSVAGGLLQGASIPIRGIAGLIPLEFSKNIANSKNLTQLFPTSEDSQSTGKNSAQIASELVGGGGIFGKLLGGLKVVSTLAKVPEILQSPLSLASAGAIATPGDSTQRALGAGGALALGAGGKILEKGVDKLPAFFRGLTSKSTPENLVESIQKPHDILESTKDELYGQVKNSINKRNIKIPIKEEFLSQAREYFPKNKTSVNDLFERAKNGDYDAIHKIQSSLYKKGTKQLAGDDLVKENEGEDILDLRDRMNDFLETHLLKEGHGDIAHVLKQAKKANKTIKDTYYAKNLPKSISQLVQKDFRLVPKNPEQLLSQNSLPVKNFLEKHPESAKHYQGITEKKDALKALNKLFIGTGLGGGTLSGGKLLYDLFKQ